MDTGTTISSTALGAFRSLAGVSQADSPAAVPARRAAPPVSCLLLAWFSWLGRRMLKQSFNTVRVSVRGGIPQLDGLPAVFYLNHASWWDPLVCLFLAQSLFPDRRCYAPIDAAMLKKYRFFSRLGFFGVEQGTTRGAATFARCSRAVLSDPVSALWLTPQGRFADVRERPVRLRGGLGHLPRQVRQAWFVPVAIEYVFWEEKCPEVLVRFGSPIRIAQGARTGSVDRWQSLFEESLSLTQAELSAESIRRDLNDFRILLRGRSGTHRVYDLWLQAKAAWKGEAVRLQHGTKQ